MCLKIPIIQFFMCFFPPRYIDILFVICRTDDFRSTNINVFIGTALVCGFILFALNKLQGIRPSLWMWEYYVEQSL